MLVMVVMLGFLLQGAICFCRVDKMVVYAAGFGIG